MRVGKLSFSFGIVAGLVVAGVAASTFIKLFFVAAMIIYQIE